MVYSIHMNQIMKETVCENQKFRACVVEDSKCVNCGKLFTELLNKGDWINHKCWSCRELKNIQVQYVWNGSQIEGRCKECLAMDKSIGKLFQDFVWSSDSDLTNEEITRKENDSLDKIVKLPESQLKEFLRRMNSGIER